MNEQLIENLPVYYRVDLGERLREAVKMGNSVNLIGLPSVGKYTYLRFFEKNAPQYFNDKVKRRFVFVDFREFSGTSFDDVVAFLALRIDTSGSEQSWEERMKRVASKEQLILTIRNLDNVPIDILPEIIRFLLVLRQEPYGVRLVLVSTRPLREILKDETARSRLLRFELYFEPSSMTDVWVELSTYGEMVGRKFQNDERFKIFQLTGGLGGYLKTIMTDVAEKGDLQFEKTDLLRSFMAISQEIAANFTKEERDELLLVAKDELEEFRVISDVVRSLGAVRRGEAGVDIFSSEFNRYLLESQ